MPALCFHGISERRSFVVFESGLTASPMIAERRMQTVPCQHVDLAIEQRVEILTEPHDAQQRTVRIHAHEEIDVAVRAVIATRDGPEHTEIPRPALCRYPQDLVTFLQQIHGRVAAPIVDA
jgi:hypothetical protein